jgi:hypothetical protein
MQGEPARIDPEAWMRTVFSSRDAGRGGVIKRQICDVERIVGRNVFLAEVERRGWQALENGRHFIVCCNAEPIRRGPDETGRFGDFGGRFVSETLMPLILELEAQYENAKTDRASGPKWTISGPIMSAAPARSTSPSG